MKKIASPTAQEFFVTTESPVGPLAVIWSFHPDRPRILCILLAPPGISAAQRARTLFPGSEPFSCRAMDTVARRILASLTDADIRFSLDLVRMDPCSPFQQRVLRATHKIPRGRVASYQRIAERIGAPRATRAVGTALARNPFPILIPCHRVIRSDGMMGGFGGSPGMKRALLEREGVRFDRQGKIVEEDLLC